MTISNAEELKTFLKDNFHHLSDEQYIQIISETMGVYEHSKPADLNQLINKIDTHWNYLQSYEQRQELPLFFIIDNGSDL